MIKNLSLRSYLCVIFSLLLHIQIASAQTCSVNAGVNQTICMGQPLTLTGVAGFNQSVPPLISWTKLSGPSATITSPASLTTTVTGFTPGNYVFQISSRCSDLKFARQSVYVIVLPLPPTAIAGPDVTQCINTPGIQLNANAVSSPNTGLWTVSPTGGSFSPNASAPNAIYTPPVGKATYVLTWTISNGFCSTNDTKLVKISTPTTPISAGTTINLSCGGSCVTLNGSDPGISPPQSGLWTVISGPNTPVIINPTIRNSQVCGLIPGSYQLRWTVSGPCASGSADVTINVNNISAALVAQAAVNYASICNTPPVTIQTLTGIPLTAGETGVWTQTGGGVPPYPNVTFSPSNTVASPTVSGMTGTFPYIFTYSRTSDLGCTASTVHTIYRNTHISNLSTPADQELVCDATSTTFTLSYDNAANITTGLIRTAVRISGPAALGGAVVTSTSPATTVGTGTRTDTWTASAMTTPGTYVFRIEYRSDCGSEYRTIRITVSRTPSVVTIGTSIVLPCNILSANPVASLGTVGAVTWSQVTGPNTATLANINTNSLTMTNLTQGVYRMRLSNTGGLTCPAFPQDVLVAVTQSVPTVATTGANATICAGNYRLTANTVNAPTETGTWTVTPSTGISFLPDANTPNAIATGMAINTAYTFRWTVSNSCGSIFSERVLTTTSAQSPPIANAGADVCVAAGTSTQALNGSDPGAATITWTALDAGSSVSPSNTRATTATLTTAGTYRFEYALSTPGCTIMRDTVVLTRNLAITSNAGSNFGICTPTLPVSATLTGNVPPAGATGTWSQIAGPITTTITSPTSNSTTVTGLTVGNFSYQYRVSTGGVCADATSNVVVRVTQEPSAAVAGPDQSVCNVTTGTAVPLAATAPSIGTGYWHVLTGPQGSTPTFSNAISPTSTISNLMHGVYTLRWTTTSGAGCPQKTADMTLTISAAANAGSTINLCNVTTAPLTGNANTSGTWSYVSGPSVATLTANAPHTAVASGLTTGTYVFRYSLPAVGPCPATSSDVQLNNYAEPSKADAGPIVKVCFNVSTATLIGNTAASGIGAWSRISGPNFPTAGTANSMYQDTIINSLISGLYVYRYSINTNAVCTPSISDMQIIKEVAANAGTIIRECNVSFVSLNATPGLQSEGTWSADSGPSAVSFANVHAPNTTVSGLVPGTYLLRWTLASPIGLSCAVNTGTVQVIIDPEVPAMDAGEDRTFCEGSIPAFTIGSAAQSPVVYSWSPATLLSSTTIAQPQFTGVNNAGTFLYTVKGTIGTCVAFDDMVIKVNPKPFAGISFTSMGCSAVTFTAASPGSTVVDPTYIWNFGPTATPTSATGPGPHVVSFTNGVSNRIISLTVNSSAGCTNATEDEINGNCYALPIILKSFNGSWKNTYTALNWQIGSSVGFSHFIVERSIDGQNFTSLQKVNFSSNTTNYNYDDKSIPANVSRLYYRLKMVDKDGKFEYSQIVHVAIKQLSAKSMFVTPNPVSSIAAVHLFSDVATSGVIRILSESGQVLYNVSPKLVKGENVIYFNNLQSIATGFCVVQAIVDGEILTQKIIVGK